jgi:hypothetical protein
VMSLSFLAKLPSSRPVPDDLERLYEMAETVNIKAGEVLIEGQPRRRPVCGSVQSQVSKRSGGTTCPYQLAAR